MFQFNFRAAIIRLATKPILKIFLLTGSWENSYKIASVNLISLRFLLCSSQSNFQVYKHPTQIWCELTHTGMILSPNNSSVIIIYWCYSAWKRIKGVGNWVTLSHTMPPGHRYTGALRPPVSCNIALPAVPTHTTPQRWQVTFHWCIWKTVH